MEYRESLSHIFSYLPDFTYRFVCKLWSEVVPNSHPFIENDILKEANRLYMPDTPFIRRLIKKSRNDEYFYLTWLNTPEKDLRSVRLLDWVITITDAYNYMSKLISGSSTKQKEDIVKCIIAHDAIDCLEVILKTGEEVWRTLIAREYMNVEQRCSDEGTSIIRKNFYCTIFLMENYPTLISPNNEELHILLELGYFDIARYYIKEGYFEDEIDELSLRTAQYEQYKEEYESLGLTKALEELESIINNYIAKE